MTHPSIFQRVANLTASPAVFLDSRGDPAAWNAPAERLGLVVRFRAAARNPLATDDAYSSLVRRLLRDGDCPQTELLLLHEGRAIRLLAHGCAICDGDGQPLGALLIFEPTASVVPSRPPQVTTRSF